jgi:hypothetical protein
VTNNVTIFKGDTDALIKEYKAFVELLGNIIDANKFRATNDNDWPQGLIEQMEDQYKDLQEFVDWLEDYHTYDPG